MKGLVFFPLYTSRAGNFTFSPTSLFCFSFCLSDLLTFGWFFLKRGGRKAASRRRFPDALQHSGSQRGKQNRFVGLWPLPPLLNNPLGCLNAVTSFSSLESCLWHRSGGAGAERWFIDVAYCPEEWVSAERVLPGFAHSKTKALGGLCYTESADRKLKISPLIHP